MTLVRRSISLTCGCFYVGLLIFSSRRHTPWFDEAQAWLIARDSSLTEILYIDLRREGHPALWYVLLKGMQRLSSQYWMLKVSSALSAIAGAAYFMRRSPMPLPLRLLFPFGYLVFFQYGVISRSHSLFPLLYLRVVHAIRNGASQWRVIGALSLLSNLSLHGTVCAVALDAVYLRQQVSRLTTLKGFRRDSAVPQLFFLANLIQIALVLWRPKDRVSVTSGHVPSIREALANIASQLRAAFLEQTVPSIAVLLISSLYAWTQPGFLYFFIPIICLLTFNLLVYGERWHWGLLYIVWLGGLWAVWPSEALGVLRKAPVLQKFIYAVLGVVVLEHIYWNHQAIRADRECPYSGARTAALVLDPLVQKRVRISGLSYNCASILPYFPHNIFTNDGHVLRRRFWRWSTDNPVNSTWATLGTHTIAEDHCLVIGSNAHSQEGLRMLWLMRSIYDFQGFRGHYVAQGILRWKGKQIGVESFLILLKKAEKLITLEA